MMARHQEAARNLRQWRWVATVFCMLCVGLIWVAEAQAHKPKPRFLGNFKLTYYHVAVENPSEDTAGGKREVEFWPIYSRSCNKVIAYTSQVFHQALSLEGTGVLWDGRLVNFVERCSCARPGFKGSRICYQVLDRKKYPWGQGAYYKGKPLALRPFRSLAVDPALIPMGTLLYLPQLKGKKGHKGKPMNGCFRAEDQGSMIKGKRLDFFTGTAYWGRLFWKRVGLTKLRVYHGGKICRGRLG